MKQEEILRKIWEEKDRQKTSRKEIEAIAGVTTGGVLEVLNGNAHTMGLLNILKLLEALGLTLVVEDIDAEWGLDMRLRCMPKKLFVVERIDSREVIRKDGFHARVDMFESPEAALKIFSKPCDIYEIWPHRLIRKHFDVVDHPFGPMYAYNNWVAPEYIENRVTHR